MKFYQGLLIFLSTSITTGLLFYKMNIKGFDIFSDILLGLIFGMVPMIIIVASMPNVKSPITSGEHSK